MLEEREYVIAQGKTDFQEYLFFHSKEHGVCIMLDGDLQSCASDEALYHEALVHPAMSAHPNPKKVLIMGGGEGATAREVLKFASVESVVMVDIDEEFVSLCQKYIPSWSEGAFDDARVELHHKDINVYLQETQEKFDVVIGDLVDVADWDSPLASLYGEILYKKIKAHLREGGVVATQAGAYDADVSKNLQRITKTMQSVFGDVQSYGAEVPSFETFWGFVLASEDLSQGKKRGAL